MLGPSIYQKYLALHKTNLAIKYYLLITCETLPNLISNIFSFFLHRTLGRRCCNVVTTSF